MSKMRQQMEDVKRRFGFVSDYQRPRWKNFEDAAGKMNTSLLQHQISNKSCHNLLRCLDLPPYTSQLLGLDLNYCVKPSSINSTIDAAFKRLPNNIRRMYHLKTSWAATTFHLSTLFLILSLIQHQTGLKRQYNNLLLRSRVL